MHWRAFISPIEPARAEANADRIIFTASTASTTDPPSHMHQRTAENCSNAVMPASASTA
jgi:hypothetical protein